VSIVTPAEGPSLGMAPEGTWRICRERPLKNVQFVIANEEKQSHKPLIIKETATAHMRLAMTGSAFFNNSIGNSQAQNGHRQS
jgi:hypothetical protein